VGYSVKTRVPSGVSAGAHSTHWLSQTFPSIQIKKENLKALVWGVEMSVPSVAVRESSLCSFLFLLPAAHEPVKAV